jgi:hypothetical protein
MTTESDDEQAYRDAIAAGDDSAWDGLGRVLSAQPARTHEAEAAFRSATRSRAARSTSGDSSAACSPGSPVASRRPRTLTARRSPPGTTARVRASLRITGDGHRR